VCGLRVDPATFKILVIAATFVVVAGGSAANSNLGGRLIWTYQSGKDPVQKQEVFVQHYEAYIRDRLFEKNDMKLAFYFDSSKNLTFDQTLMRYRGELGIFHRNYSLDARYAPRQEITPLQSPIDQEFMEGQATLRVHVPNTPHLRLFYARRAQYLQGLFTGRSRDLRGELTYRWKVFDFGLNRWNTKRTNGTDTGTTVTGGRVRYGQSFGPMLNVQTGYDYQNTVNSRSISIAEINTTNQTFNALLSSFYQNIVSGSFSLVSRRLTTKQITEIKNRNDVIAVNAKFLPTSPLRMEVLWNYLLSEQNGLRNLADYATIQAILTGPRRGRWHGLAQMSRRFVLDVEGAGVIPPNIYYVSLRGDVYRGVDARAEVNISEQHNESFANTRKYQTVSLLELYLKPRSSWLLTLNARSTKYSDRAIFLKNDRFDYGLTANYFARQYFNTSADLRRTEVTIGKRRKDTSFVVNANVVMRGRSTLTLSYGINTVQFLDPGQPEEIDPDKRANTLNLQFQIWVTRRGSFSLNFTDVSRDDGFDTNYLAVNYRQDF